MGEVISITTIDRGRIVGAFSLFLSFCVCGIQRGGS